MRLSCFVYGFHARAQDVENRNPLVSIVVLNWNGKDFLEKCFSSLLDCKYGPKEIIMVDNGSTDGSIEYVENHFPSIKIVKNKTNKGVGSGFNSGISVSQGKYIVNLANDTSVHPNFIDEFVKVLENDETIGACQHKLLLMRDNKTLDAVGSFLTISGFLIHQGIFEKDEHYDKVQEVFTAKGSAITFRRSVLNIVGVYDPEIFLYFEDVDLCWRIWLSGFKIVFIPNSVVYHHLGGALPRIPSFHSDYHSFKNRLRTLLIYLEVRNLIKILPLHISVCAGMFLFYLWKGKVLNAVSILNGMISNIVDFRKTFKKRLFVQKNIRRVTDEFLMPKITKKMNMSKMAPSSYKRYLESQ